MTIEINLTAEIQRINERLKAETPGSDIYHRLMEDLKTAVTLYRGEEVHKKFASLACDDSTGDIPCSVEDHGDRFGIYDAVIAHADGTVKPVGATSPVDDPDPTDPGQAQEPEREKPKAEETAEPEAHKPDPATLPKKADVRLALGKARTERGVNVTEILQGMGVDNFNDLPPERYPELLEKLG